ncbi:DUF6916 family protein [Cellulomonas hominis]|uniref:DUF6916 family protein n=1 Tax=Cellulomonas hominis TaxID=156981 RepID=UPI001B91D897|nr:hypothetical protein [Cellulomonas hominis]VTR75756.1 hypothetical protein CHMI_00509 [Cellulomonas hominis]
MPTRRTVLVAGATVAVAAATGGVALGVRRPRLALTVAALRPLVGSRFDVDGVPFTLSDLTGLSDATPRDDAFRLVLTADRPVELPGGTRTFTHASGDLLLSTEPVGPEGTTLEAVVHRAA